MEEIENKIKKHLKNNDFFKIEETITKEYKKFINKNNKEPKEIIIGKDLENEINKDLNDNNSISPYYNSIIRKLKFKYIANSFYIGFK